MWYGKAGGKSNNILVPLVTLPDPSSIATPRFGWLPGWLVAYFQFFIPNAATGMKAARTINTISMNSVRPMQCMRGQN